jgi:hypothetical protein
LTKTFSISSLSLFGSPATSTSTSTSGVYDIVILHNGEPLAFVDFLDGRLNAARRGKTVVPLHMDARVPSASYISASDFIHEHHDAIVELVKATAKELGLEIN